MINVLRRDIWGDGSKVMEVDVGAVSAATNRGRPEASRGEKGKEAFFPKPSEGHSSGNTLILNSDCQTDIE